MLEALPPGLVALGTTGVVPETTCVTWQLLQLVILLVLDSQERTSGLKHILVVFASAVGIWFTNSSFDDMDPFIHNAQRPGKYFFKVELMQIKQGFLHLSHRGTWNPVG